MPTLDQQLDEFEEHGPFTFKRVFALVKLCAKSKEHLDFHDVLDDNLHKFPPEELEQILDAIADENGPNYKIWEEGCSYNNTFKNGTGKFSKEQLEVIAKSNLEIRLETRAMDVEDKLAILLVENRHYQKQRAAKKRDKSPSRK